MHRQVCPLEAQVDAVAPLVAYEPGSLASPDLAKAEASEQLQGRSVPRVDVGLDRFQQVKAEGAVEHRLQSFCCKASAPIIWVEDEPDLGEAVETCLADDIALVLDDEVLTLFRRYPAEWRKYSRRRKARSLARDLRFALAVFVASFFGAWSYLAGSVPGWQSASAAVVSLTASPKADFSDPAYFACSAPTHYDGDAIRCAGQNRSMRLHAIDAPEMPGSCRPGRDCTPGDPYASRDHLASLTYGRTVRCREIDTDHYGRSVVQCFAGDADRSCAMVRNGYAVERYGWLTC